jgi:hypothetical protein
MDIPRYLCSLSHSFLLALKRVPWIGPSPRVSREHILIVRTLRAKGTIQGTLPFLFHHFHGQAVQKDRPARPQAEQEPEAYPLGYVEDSCELRTPLAGFFNSLLEVVLRHAISQRIARDLEESACFGDVAACAL